ncbi:MAG: hypothetical protein ACR2N9_03505 [Acidimicrobiia bacterium]
MTGSPTPRPPLPADAPDELKEFIAGRVDELSLEPDRAHWIPKPLPFIPDAIMPAVKVRNGGPPNTVAVAVGWSVLFRFKLRASIVRGKLHVRGGGPLHHHIEDWVAQFNESLGTDRRLHTLEVVDNSVHLRCVTSGRPLDRTVPDA